METAMHGRGQASCGRYPSGHQVLRVLSFEGHRVEGLRVEGLLDLGDHEVVDQLDEALPGAWRGMCEGRHPVESGP